MFRDLDWPERLGAMISTADGVAGVVLLGLGLA